MFLQEKAELHLGSDFGRSHPRGFSAAQPTPALLPTPPPALARCSEGAGRAPEHRPIPPYHLKEGIWLVKIKFLCNQPDQNTFRVTSRRSFPPSSLSSVAYIIYLLNILLFRCAERETVIKNCASTLLVITRGAGQGRGACGDSSYVSRSGALKSLSFKVCLCKAPRRLFRNKQMPVCICIHTYIII